MSQVPYLGTIHGAREKLLKDLEDDPYNEWFAHDAWDQDVPIWRVKEDLEDSQADVISARDNIYVLTNGVTVCRQ